MKTKNRLCILEKLIKLKKQDYISINPSIVVYICMYLYVNVYLSPSFLNEKKDNL